ncbi:hypothetical protein LOK49_Contig704G00002 [Camellia lanceoleosa]|nr:hypothetical protein LOK49_Contig704G00002 [Camellia lanceoleosa]
MLVSICCRIVLVQGFSFNYQQVSVRLAAPVHNPIPCFLESGLNLWKCEACCWEVYWKDGICLLWNLLDSRAAGSDLFALLRSVWGYFGTGSAPAGVESTWCPLFEVCVGRYPDEKDGGNDGAEPVVSVASAAEDEDEPEYHDATDDRKDT